MKILFHIPSLDTIYALRSIYNGFKNAFIYEGDSFENYNQNLNFEEVLYKFNPDLFITSSHYWHRKQIDFNILNAFRKKGMFVLVKIDFWNSPFSKFKINEAKPLKHDKELINLIKTDKFGDSYYHNVEQEDKRMEGFSTCTGRKFHTIPLACDTIELNKFEKNSDYASEICFIGTNLNSKKNFFKRNIKKLTQKYSLKIIGQDWTVCDQFLGNIQRFGQYFNLGYLKKIRKPKIKLFEEGMYYYNSKICLNVHENYQKSYGGDCNERSFKIPYSSGFQLTDEVECLKKYFRKDEIEFYKDDYELFEKIDYFIKNDRARMEIVEKSKSRVLKDHTYLNRVKYIKEKVIYGKY